MLLAQDQPDWGNLVYILIFAAISVVGGVVEKLKKRREQRERERTAQKPSGTAAAPGPQRTAGTRPVRVEPTARAEPVARAELPRPDPEFRVPEPIRPAPQAPPRPTSQPPAPPTRPLPPRAPAPPDAARARAPGPERPRVPEPVRARIPEAIRARLPETISPDELRRRLRARERAVPARPSPPQPVAQVAAAAVPPAPAGSPAQGENAVRRRVIALLRDPHDLRAGLLLSEVLGPPLALRDRGEA